MNYVVIPLYELKPEVYPVLEKMKALCMASFVQHLQGEWVFLTLTGRFTGTFDEQFSAMHQDIFNRLYEINRAGNDILFVDPDTLCVKNVDLFGKYQDMAMFYLTTYPHKLFPEYFNAGVMYFPATMQQEIWEIGKSHMAQIRRWDDSQEVYNQMFFAQEKGPFSKDPTLNYCPDVPTTIKEKQAKIIHFHSSKDYGKVLMNMKEHLFR